MCKSLECLMSFLLLELLIKVWLFILLHLLLQVLALVRPCFYSGLILFVLMLSACVWLWQCRRKMLISLNKSIKTI